MKNTIFYLSTCDTCKRIMKEVENMERFELIDIKINNISVPELDEIHSLSGLSYEGLFNKRARKFKEIKESNRILSETLYEKLIVEEYTFLKRPVVVYDNQVYVGNSKSEVNRMLQAVNV